MKKMILSALLLACASMPLFAQTTTVSDSLSIQNDVYKEEAGFFHKAYRDASDPSFMITDEKGNFSLGVGGTVVSSAFFDFGGSIDHYTFSTASIGVPADTKNHFGFTVTGSNIYLKARSTQGKHKLAAYLEMTGFQSAAGNMAMLSQAYVSLDRISIGMIPSFFMDMEAGVRTVDLAGPNVQIYSIHPLVGYSQAFGEHLSMGVALEQPTEITSAFLYTAGVTAEWNRYPDLAARVKYRGKLGHIQLSGLLREMSYWAVTPGSTTEGKSFYKQGYGVALSGNLTPTEKLTFTAQGVMGRGISSYINDISSLNANMVYSLAPDENGYVELLPTPVMGGYVGASYLLSQRMQASALVGYCQMDVTKEQDAATDYHRSLYSTLNLFYFLSQRCMVGAEYAFGMKEVYPATAEAPTRGQANRLDACFIYRF